MQNVFFAAITGARHAHVSGRTLLLTLRCTSAFSIVQIRGAKHKFGGITRDPFQNFKKKLAQQEQRKQRKVPLKSEERMQMERLYPLHVTSINQLISTYVPLEKFAKAPLYTSQGCGQRWLAFKQNLAVIYSGAMIRRKLRKSDPFKPVQLARKAQDNFIEVNHAIQQKDKHKLRELTTETASESLKMEFQHRRFVWKFIEEIERPRIVNARITPFNTKDNLFAQITVRMHSKQILATYNAAGGLVQGNTSVPKDVIDYVVFERHITEESSSWRISAKLPPQKPWQQEATQKQKPTGQKALPA